MFNFAVDSIPGPTDLSAARTSVITTCVILVVWIGLLARPGRAMLFFAMGFMLALMGTYGSIMMSAMDIDTTQHPVGIAVAFGAPMLIWSGIRVANGRRRAYPWIGFVQSALSVVVLSVTTYLPSSFTVFRWVFLVAALGCVLGAVEILRGGFRSSRFATPLIAVSFAGFAFAVIGLVPTILPGTSQTDSDLLFLRNAALASSTYIICATVSVLFLANRRPGARDVLEAIDAFNPLTLFLAQTRERLSRAAARHERAWTIIDLRIDDAADIRGATGDVAFGSIARRFESIIASTLPAEADLCRIEPGHVVVLVAQPGRALRDVVRAIMTAFSADDVGTPISVRISASAGIVPVALGVDTAESVVASASRAAAAAQSKGGDQITLLEPRATRPSQPVTW